jgi:predicted nucleic acid-binding protein
VNETLVITAFLDANVLYPAFLRDVLLRLASQNAFQARRSAQVLDEWMAALTRDRPDIPLARMQRTLQLMAMHFQNARVDGYEHLIETITLPDADDRHVLAAAMHCGARVIVTMNLRDFPDEALADFEIEAVHPDVFILGLLGTHQRAVVTALQRLRNSLRKPSQDAVDLLASMKRQGLAQSADALGIFIDDL